jgi:hypothetical protein
MKVIETTTRTFDVGTIRKHMARHASSDAELRIWKKCLERFIKRGTVIFKNPKKERKPGIQKWATERFEAIVNMSVTHSVDGRWRTEGVTVTELELF